MKLVQRRRGRTGKVRRKTMKKKMMMMTTILMKINVLITQTEHLNVHPTMSLGVIGMIFGYPVSMLNVP